MSALTRAQNTDINLWRSVRNGDFPTTAICSITVSNPNLNIIIPFRNMTYNPNAQIYNYTVSASNTTLLGTYLYDITCTNSTLGLNKTISDSFNITPNGQEYTISQSFTYFIILVILVVLFGLSLYASLVVPMKNERKIDGEIMMINYRKYFKMFCMAMTYVFLVWIVYITSAISYGYLQLQGIGVFFRYIYTMLLAMMLPVMIMIVIIGLIYYINDKKIEKYIKMGVSTLDE